MASSYSASCRFNLQGTGDNPNAWGNVLNTGVFALVDASIAGWATIALSGDLSLSTANGSSDQARLAMLKFTGAGAFQVTIPAVSKRYDIWNSCTGVLTLTNGSTSVTVQPGEKVAVMTDGGANFARVQPTDFGGQRITSLGAPTTSTDAATKKYVDDTAFALAAGSLPGQTGNGGKFLQTDGSALSWAWAVTAGGGLASVSGATLTVTAAATSDVRTGTDTTKATTVGALFGAAAPVAVAFSSTLTLDLSAGPSFDVGAATANLTLANPSGGMTPGRSGRIRLQEDATGGRTISYGSYWTPVQGSHYVMPAAANAVGYLYYFVRSATEVEYSLVSV